MNDGHHHTPVRPVTVGTVIRAQRAYVSPFLEPTLYYGYGVDTNHGERKTAAPAQGHRNAEAEP